MDSTVNKKTNLKSMNLIFKSIGFIILLILINRIDINKLMDNLFGLKIEYLLLAVLMTIPFFTIKISRWVFILKKVGINYSFFNAVKTYGAGLFAGQVTPGQMGELIRSVFMARQGYDLSLTIGTVILERLFDLLLLLILAVPGITIFLDKEIGFYLYGSIILVLSFIVVYLICKKIKAIDFLLSKPFFNKILSKIKINFDYLKNIITDKQSLGLVISMTILAFIINIIRFYLLAMALSIDIPIVHFIFGIAFVSIIGLLPISVAGIGTRDAAMVLFFSASGQSPEQAIAFSMLILIVAYGLNIIWGFPGWLLESK